MESLESVMAATATALVRTVQARDERREELGLDSQQRRSEGLKVGGTQGPSESLQKVPH